jgi:hypothetical protein
MIGVIVEEVQLKNLVKELRKIGKVIASPNLQLYRASAYRQFTMMMTETGKLGLKPINYATQVISGMHEPEWNDGSLVASMKVKPAGRNAADVGYFAGDSEKIPGKNVTITDAAVMQHTGYRISLMGEKGQRVMRWLGAQGVFDQGTLFGQKVKKSDSWLEVAPRPFMLSALARYEEVNGDMQATDEFIDKMLQAPGGISLPNMKEGTLF